jgi:TIGR03009 family protein
MTSLSALRAQVVRTTKDKLFHEVEVYEGTFQFQKPNRGLLELHKRGEPGVFEKYICTGTRLYEYVPRDKVIRVHELPPPRSPLLDLAADSLPAFLLGPKAEEARRRYELKLVKEDAWYVYIEILPHLLQDKADFRRARWVLNKSTFLPRQLTIEEPNGNETIWDFPRLERNVSFDRKEFDAPKPAPGWRLLRLSGPGDPPRDAPPAEERE